MPVHARHRLLLIAVALFALSCQLPTALVAADAAGAAPEVVQVAPGVWSCSWGQPEALVPSRFRVREPEQGGLAALPAVAAAPFPPAALGFIRQARGCTISIPLEAGEEVYGFGLQLHALHPSGRRMFLRASDAPDSDLGDSHAAVPFLVTTRGRALLVDSARNVSAWFGNLDPQAGAPGAASAPGAIATSTAQLYAARAPHDRTVYFDVPVAQGVTIFQFAGPTMLDAVRRSNCFAGGGALPPLHGLGIHYRGMGTFNAEQTIGLAKELRDHHIPCDMWGVEPGWQSHSYSCSFVWAHDRFPDPDAFLEAMRGMGLAVNLWEHCFTHPSSPIHDRLAGVSGDYQVWGGLVPDFALPEARRIFTDYHAAQVVRGKVAGFKLDECDNQPTSPQPWSFPDFSHFPSGLDGEQQHQLLGVLYQGTMLELFVGANRRSWNLVRQSHSFAAPLPYVLYSDTYDHRAYVRGLLSAGFSGLLWTPEVRESGSIEELLRRVETTIFSPMACINAWYLPHPPWFQIDKERNGRNERMDDADAAELHVRELFNLRMRLLPYLYAAFCDYRWRGTPPFRHPVTDWPDDPAVRALEDQWLVGPSLMVAPLFAGQRTRQVYLPKGTWYDLKGDRSWQGGRAIAIAAAPEEIPVFVRGGTILPLAEPVEHVAADTVFALTCRVYGDQPAPATLIEDDGETMAAERGQRTALTLTWTADAGGALQRSGPYAQPRYRIAGWEVATAAASRDPVGVPGAILVSAGATWKASSAAAGDAGSGRLLDAEQGDDPFAFHTLKERSPWVIIDLGRPRSLTGIVILNRADERAEILARAATLTAATSLDGQEWVEAWRADGAEREWRTSFAAPRQARYLRLSLAGEEFLHLKRVRIYGTAAP
jgi:alpha-D-xyloside xylohydrolase